MDVISFFTTETIKPYSICIQCLEIYLYIVTRRRNPQELVERFGVTSDSGNSNYIQGGPVETDPSS